MIRSICFAFVLFLAYNLKAQSDYNIKEYMEDMQRWERDNDVMSLSLWMPNGYWRVALEEYAAIPDEVIDLVETTLEDYVFICAADITVSLGGAMTARGEEALRNDIKIIDANGKEYVPLSQSEISDQTMLFVDQFRPTLVQMLGQFGEGLQIFLFQIKDEEGHNLISEVKEGRFSVVHSGHEFIYDLPLPSFLPPKTCPIDKEKMRGNWTYCPFHGTELK